MLLQAFQLQHWSIRPWCWRACSWPGVDPLHPLWSHWLSLHVCYFNKPSLPGENRRGFGIKPLLGLHILQMVVDESQWSVGVDCDHVVVLPENSWKKHSLNWVRRVRHGRLVPQCSNRQCFLSLKTTGPPSAAAVAWEAKRCFTWALCLRQYLWFPCLSLLASLTLGLKYANTAYGIEVEKKSHINSASGQSLPSILGVRHDVELRPHGSCKPPPHTSCVPGRIS